MLQLVPKAVERAIDKTAGDVLVFLAGEDCIEDMKYQLYQQGAKTLSTEENLLE